MIKMYSHRLGPFNKKINPNFFDYSLVFGGLRSLVQLSRANSEWSEKKWWVILRNFILLIRFFFVTWKIKRKMRVAACSQYRSILLVRRHFGATVARAGFFGSRHSFEDPFDEEFERGHEKKHREKVEDLYRKDIERRQWQERKCKSLLNLDSGLQYKRAELKDAYLTRSKGKVRRILENLKFCKYL